MGFKVQSSKFKKATDCMDVTDLKMQFIFFIREIRVIRG